MHLQLDLPWGVQLCQAPPAPPAPPLPQPLPPPQLIHMHTPRRTHRTRTMGTSPSLKRPSPLNRIPRHLSLPLTLAGGGCGLAQWGEGVSCNCLSCLSALPLHLCDAMSSFIAAFIFILLCTDCSLFRPLDTFPFLLTFYNAFSIHQSHSSTGSTVMSCH